nr:sigma factor [uncultured Mediterraneibacter sp.]
MKSLVKRAQRGDDQAFVELIEENKQAMYKVAVGILKNDFDAADAIQESILTCYEKLRELKKAQYFKTWLLRILINNCNQMHIVMDMKCILL